MIFSQDINLFKTVYTYKYSLDCRSEPTNSGRCDSIYTILIFQSAIVSERLSLEVFLETQPLHHLQCTFITWPKHRKSFRYITSKSQERSVQPSHRYESAWNIDTHPTREPERYPSQTNIKIWRLQVILLVLGMVFKYVDRSIHQSDQTVN